MKAILHIAESERERGNMPSERCRVYAKDS